MPMIKCIQCDNLFKDHIKKENGKWLDISHRKKCTVCQPLKQMSQKLRHQCLCCGKLTTNPKFCCQQCSASITNKNKPKKKYFCVQCGLLIGVGFDNVKGKKICPACKPKRNYYNITSHWDGLTLGYFKSKSKNKYQYHAKIRSWARTTYIKSCKPQKCQKCGYDKHYEICHIKPVSKFSDKDLISDINHIDNLIALCPNCHWELDHGLL